MNDDEDWDWYPDPVNPDVPTVTYEEPEPWGFWLPGDVWHEIPPPKFGFGRHLEEKQ